MSVFLFTLDYNVPFVPSDKEYKVVFVRERERVVIPCRGSVEDLNVTLHNVSIFNLFIVLTEDYTLSKKPYSH